MTVWYSLRLGSSAEERVNSPSMPGAYSTWEVEGSSVFQVTMRVDFWSLPCPCISVWIVMLEIVGKIMFFYGV